MAKRSDFAQKLLDDLRLRKERMAASQSSTSSKPMNRDAFSYSKQTHRGSREPKTHQMNGFRNGSAQGRTTGAYKLYVEDASREIVPYGSGHSSEQMGDLSMALAMAFQNGGKHTRMDSSGNNSMFSFLNQIGRRSVDFSMIERSGFGRYENSAGQVPIFSNLHIEDIAKGAQRLKQILRACSNGQSFNRYSIEIGKELLKGAMDLEESLRMLVNLQEASDYMITPQRNSRITLLDEEEDENNDTINTAEQKQLGLPIFSFDRRSRNSHHIQEVAKSDLKQRLIALSYLSKATNFNHDAQASSTPNTVSHKRSASHGSGIKTSSSNSDRKNLTSLSKPKPDNGRIPNVIAKLMGLEEIPQEGDSKNITPNVSSSKHKTDRISVKKIPAGSPAITQKKKGTENVSSQTKKQAKAQPNQTQNIQATTHAMQAEKNQATYHASFEGKNHEVLPLKKDVMRGSNKAYTKLDRYQNNSAELKQSIHRQKDILEKKRQEDAIKMREQKRKENGETKKLAFRLHQQHLAPQTQRASELANALQRQTKNTSIEHKADKEESHNPPVNRQLKSPNDPKDQKPCIMHNFDTQNLENQAAQTEQMGAKQSTQVRRQKESEAMSTIVAHHVHDEANMQRKDLQVDQATTSSKSSTESIVAMKSNGSPPNREDPSQFRSANNSNINMQDSMIHDSSQVVSARDKKSEITKVKISTPQAMKERSVHLLTAKNVKNTKNHKIESPQKVDEVRNRNGIPKHLSKPLKHQFSISQVKQRNQGRLDASKEDAHVRISMHKEVDEISRCKEAETDIFGPDQFVTGSQQPKMVEENVNGVQKTSILYNHSEAVHSQCQHNKEPETQDLSESFQEIISTVLKDQKGEDFGKGELQHHHILLDQLYASHKGDKIITLASKLEKHNKPRLQEPLTEGENHLKKILIENQAFLNAAEAFFNLTIPLDIFHASSDSPNEETKLVQDCGYEITRRSGKIQALSIHPFMSELIASLRVNSLDELIKVLNKDLETLKFYGRNNIGNVQCPIEEYLPKMLENDVYNKDPHMNCMWDIGWDKLMFSFEEKDGVIRDVEKQLLNGLLDDVTRDLLLVY